MTAIGHYYHAVKTCDSVYAETKGGRATTSSYPTTTKQEQSLDVSRSMDNTSLLYFHDRNPELCRHARVAP